MFKSLTNFFRRLYELLDKFTPHGIVLISILLPITYVLGTLDLTGVSLISILVFLLGIQMLVRRAQKRFKSG